MLFEIFSIIVVFLLSIVYVSLVVQIKDLNEALSRSRSLHYTYKELSERLIMARDLKANQEEYENKTKNVQV